MDIQLKKGLIESHVLYILKGNPTYGYELYSTISKDMTISESTLYPIFKRLVNDGYVENFQEEHNGRLRKYYSLTEKGKERLKEFADMYKDMQVIINRIVEGATND